MKVRKRPRVKLIKIATMSNILLWKLKVVSSMIIKILIMTIRFLPNLTLLKTLSIILKVILLRISMIHEESCKLKNESLKDLIENNCYCTSTATLPAKQIHEFKK